MDRYDEDSGCFYYFVKLSVERKLLDILDKANKIKTIKSLDERYYDEGDESCLDYVAEEGNYMYYETDLYGLLKDALDENSIKIVDMKMEGYNYNEIAKKLNINKQAVYRKVVYIKNIIKDIIEKID
jgi:DNA-directed RNA polymerase specialized sigma24 family protein